MPNLRQLVETTAATYGVSPDLVWRVVQAESGGNPVAVSPAGAQGLMQLMPATAQQLGVTDPFDPRQNVRGGVQYLRFLLDRYGGDPRKALAAYNAGPGRVDQAGGVPNIAETRAYVDRVAPAAPTATPTPAAETESAPIDAQLLQYRSPRATFGVAPSYNAETATWGPTPTSLQRMQPQPFLTYDAPEPSAPAPAPTQTAGQSGQNGMAYFAALAQLGAAVGQAIAAKRKRKQRGGDITVVAGGGGSSRGMGDVATGTDWTRYLPGSSA